MFSNILRQLQVLTTESSKAELQIGADTPLFGGNSPERCLGPLIYLKFEYRGAQFCY